MTKSKTVRLKPKKSSQPSIKRKEDREPEHEAVPTNHAIGSLGKVLVLAERVLRGHELWHVADSRFCASPDEEDESSVYVSKNRIGG